MGMYRGNGNTGMGLFTAFERKGCELKCWELPFVVSLSNHQAGAGKGLDAAS